MKTSCSRKHKHFLCFKTLFFLWSSDMMELDVFQKHFLIVQKPCLHLRKWMVQMFAFLVCMSRNTVQSVHNQTPVEFTFHIWIVFISSNLDTCVLLFTTRFSLDTWNMLGSRGIVFTLCCVLVDLLMLLFCAAHLHL